MQKELDAYNALAKSHNHENIVKNYDFIREEDEVWIMMEYCEHGDLDNYFRKHPTKFEAFNIKLDMMYQIASGLEYLHSKNIVHRDIKPANILVATKSEQDIVKLADFGLCKVLDPDGSTSMNTMCGTNCFKAPEFFKGNLDYHRNVDVFAAGLTFLSMIQPMRNDGSPRRLIPRMEDPVENAAEMPNTIVSIGQTMFDRIMNQRKQVEVVVEKPESAEKFDPWSNKESYSSRTEFAN